MKKIIKVSASEISDLAEVGAEDIIMFNGKPISKKMIKQMRKDPKNFAKWAKSLRN